MNIRDIDHKRWTPDEIIILQDMVLKMHHDPTLTTQDIADKLDRTRAAVDKKVKALGLRDHIPSPRRWEATHNEGYKTVDGFRLIPYAGSPTRNGY